MLEFQQKDGSVLNSVSTITRSGGKSLLIETTAISIIAWLNDDSFMLNVDSAMKWLLQQCQSGSFGSTQGTILSLKAIIKYDKLRSSTKKDGVFTVTLNDKSIGEANVSATSTDPIIFQEFGNKLIEGDNNLKLSFSSGVSMPIILSIDYYCETPETSSECEIDLLTKISNTSFEEGSGGEIMVSIKNLSNKKQGMVLGIIGLPGGLEPRHDQLKELIKLEKIDSYEINGREIVCYLRGMTENEERKFKIDFIARIPGTFTGPASRAYLYYTNEFKKWLPGLKCSISPKESDIKSSEITTKKPTGGLFSSIQNNDFDVKL